MSKKDNYFENATPDTIPTPPDQENVTPTDSISKAVEEIVDNLGGKPKNIAGDKK
jgi:hypothetical protein